MKATRNGGVMRDPVIAGAILALALVLLIAATAKGQQPATPLWERCTADQYLLWNSDLGDWDCIDAPAEPGKSISNDLRTRVLLAQKALERARADAIQAHARLLQTEQGLEYLQRNKQAVEAGRLLAEIERRAASVCAAHDGMEFAPNVAQCVAKPTPAEMLDPVKAGAKEKQ